MTFLRLGGLALAAVLGLSLTTIGHASAMPTNGLAAAVKQVDKPVEHVRLVCGPYRCWSTGWGWRPYAAWGWRRPLYAYGGPYMGYRRPLYAYAGWRSPYWGWRRPYAYYGYNRPLYATAGWGWRRPYYGYAGWGWRRPYAYAGWGWRRPYGYLGFNRPLYAFAGGPYLGYAGWRSWGYW